MKRLWQKGGQFGLPDAPAEVRLGSGHSADVVGQHVHQLGLRIGSAIGEDGLEMIPYAFIGIQFGGIGRERDKMQAGCA